MTKRADTWMPFYVGDYLADTLHLNTLQHGAYLLLILAYWRSGEPLNDDDEELATITRSTVAEWKKLRRSMVRFFHVDDGKWAHKRIDAELAKASSITEKRANAGRASAAAKAQRNGNTCSTHVEDVVQQNAKPSPSPSSLRSEVSDASASGGEPPPSAPDPVKAMWNRGLAIIGKDNRSLLGQMASRYGKPAVMAAIVECEREQPIEPLGYFIACCERRQVNGSGRGSAESAISKLGAWAMGEDEQEGVRRNC